MLPVDHFDPNFVARAPLHAHWGRPAGGGGAARRCPWPVMSNSATTIAGPSGSVARVADSSTSKRLPSPRNARSPNATSPGEASAFSTSSRSRSSIRAEKDVGVLPCANPNIRVSAGLTCNNFAVCAPLRLRADSRRPALRRRRPESSHARDQHRAVYGRSRPISRVVGRETAFSAPRRSADPSSLPLAADPTRPDPGFGSLGKQSAVVAHYAMQ